MTRFIEITDNRANKHFLNPDHIVAISTDLEDEVDVHLSNGDLIRAAPCGPETAQRIVSQIEGGE